MIDRSFNTSVDHRSYAEVVQKNSKNEFTVLPQQNKTKNLTPHSIPSVQQKQIHCVPSKCVPERNLNKPRLHCKGLPHEGNGASKGKSYTQEFHLPVKNRYEVLHSNADTEPKHLSHQHGTSCVTTLGGNKNKNGNKLGKNPCDVHTPDTTFNISTQQNNKIGNKLGKVTQEIPHTGTIHQCSNQVTDFMVNKNDSDQKLGEILLQTETSDNDNQAQRASIDTELVDKQPVSISHDLACMEQNDNDKYVYLYDVNNSPAKRKRNIPGYIYQSKSLCQDYAKCVQQNGKDFGFLPLNNLMTYIGEEVTWQEVPSIIEAHKIVRNSAMPNFMGVRIPVDSQLNINAWRLYLAQYWDKQIVDLLQYGFPLDFDRSRLLQSTYVNHSSALKFPDHVQNYIQTEKQYEAILGPFHELPFQCHVSPFLTRDKPNSNNRRVILDLSFPKGRSVNDGVQKDIYLNTYFELNYPSVDTVINRLRNLGTEALLYKVDISRAFRHIRIDPGDLDLLGLKHNQYFIDRTLPFGFRHGSVFFQRCTDAVRYIMKNTFQFPHLYNYIDDLIYTGLPQHIYRSYDTLIALLQELGLEISQSKLVAPTTTAICLGIEIDNINRTLKVPTDKLLEIQQICKKFACKTRVTKNQLQSLLGSLLYITKCVKPARFFLNRMLQLLRDHTDKSVILLNSAFHRDLNWFNTFLLQFNGVTFFDYKPPHHTVYLDACLTGFGAVFANKVYALPIPLAFKNYTIVHLEILNIVVAIKIWGDTWKNQVIDIQCDNMAVVEVLRSGRARDSILATCARNIWLLTAIFNIQLTVTHIPGAQNEVADLLSRWQGTDTQINKLSSYIHNYQWMPVHLDHTNLNEYV